MSHLALYRKWRPLVFDDIIGQDEIVETLKNQIRNNNFNHAYIFSGIRGTGKTSTAKVFSRAINCLDLTDINPCNVCEVCKGISDNTLMDIIEIDAASNNSVDDVRELRENVKFPPTKAKYKVYIIDEVHMLSKGAFNALLKTLEEPPEHVVFLLATTEPNKLPDTILSRCQKYDFKRVRAKEILKHMKMILKKSDIAYDEEGLSLIVSKAGGSVRDALSILDQCISHKSNAFYDDIVEMLGLVEFDFLLELSQSILDNNLNKGLELINILFDKGKDLNQFIDAILNFFRNLMIVKMHSEPTAILQCTESEVNEYKKQSQQYEMSKISRILDIFIQLERDIKTTVHGRILLETSIIKIFKTEYDYSIEALVERIEALENKLMDVEMNAARIVTSTEKIKSREPLEIKKEAPKEKQKKTADKKQSIESIQTFVDEETKVNISINEILPKWTDVLKLIKKMRIKVYAFLVEGEPVAVKGNTIILKFDKNYQFHGTNLLKKDNKQTVVEVLKKVYAKSLSIDVTYKEVKSSQTKTQDETDNINSYFSDYSEELTIKD